MEYAIIESDSTAGLEEKVRALIEEGWRPQGGISIIGQSGFYTLLQAMVRGQ